VVHWIYGWPTGLRLACRANRILDCQIAVLALNPLSNQSIACSFTTFR
jgi:hypothetical protein